MNCSTHCAARHWALIQGVDRHRLGGGISRVLSDHVTVEGGYTWQYLNRPRPLPDQNDHFAVLSLFARY